MRTRNLEILRCNCASSSLLRSPRNDGRIKSGLSHLRDPACRRARRWLRLRTCRFRHGADGAGDLALHPAARDCRAAGADLFGQLADLDIAVDVEAARLQAGFAVRGRRTRRHADRRAAGRARRPASLQAQRRRDAAGVSDRALFHPQADGLSLRRPHRGCLRRICRRHSRRPRRAVGPAADPVGQHTRLDQGSAPRRLPDLQRHRARRRADPADRQRLRQS